MAKVHPRAETPTTTTTTSISSSPSVKPKETFTIWMKSLVFHGNGCTVFGSNGDIVYRVDNYNKKCRGQVYLMDLSGKVLFSIRRKKLNVFGSWDGYKWSDEHRRLSFRVTADRKMMLSGNMKNCEVTMGCGKDKSLDGSCCYRIVGLTGKSAFTIVDSHGGIVAEIKQKQSSSGVLLGDDVLSIVVEPQVDHSLVMALVTVYGLINNKL